MPQLAPADSALMAASVISGWAFPWISDVKLLFASMSSRPRSSVTRHPCPLIAYGLAAPV